MGAAKGTNMSKQELDDILKFGTEELFKDEGKDGENEEDTNKIVYDDKMIEDMLDRNKVGEAEKAVAYNDYLQSFKVATYATKNKVGVESCR